MKTLSSLIIFLVYYVLSVIAQWKIYTKAGEKGWKSLIPVYRQYVLFKITWNTSYFWMLMAFSVVVSLCANFVNGKVNPPIILIIIGLLASLATLILHIKQCNKMSKAYGHGTGFTVGLVLLTPIFWLILGFDSSKYVGPQE